MSKRLSMSNFSYRSGTENSWRCPRAGYLEQFYLGTGIQKRPRAYWLDVGIAVHIGLVAMLEHFGVLFVDRDDCDLSNPENLKGNECNAEDSCIIEALQYWDTCGQSTVLTEYQFNEQRCLIEAILWAFYYYTLRVFLETYEVLWVEKEITEIVRGRPTYMMMSRPDAIVRSRETGEIVVISWKTIDNVTSWRRLFFKQDLQGMMEAHYTEEWMQSIANGSPEVVLLPTERSYWRGKKVSYVQTIYLVKGTRTKKDAYGEEGERDMFADETLGDEWRQDSHLIYPYSNIAEGANDTPEGGAGIFETLAWKYRYVKPGNTSFSTLGKAFKKTLVTNTSMTIREWICALNDQKVFPSTQATEMEHPLAKAIVWENPSYRDETLMKSVIAQVKESERKRHRDKKHMAMFDYECTKPQRVRLTTKGEQITFMQDLDRLFPMQLTSCSFPWSCSFKNICHTEEGRKALVQLEMPKGYTPRVPHHEPELRK